MSDNKKAVIFGSTGAVGTALAAYLSKEHPSWEIRAVSRGTDASKSRLAQLQLPNVRMVQGDALDEDSVIRLTEDCDLIYCCIGFPKYEVKYWSKHWPKVVDNLLAAVTTHNQGSSSNRVRLTFCDNLYAYGPGQNINVHTPTVEPSLKRKPGIRAILRQKFEQHMKAHPGTLTVVGSADFFGPGLTEASFLGDIMTGKIVQGQSPLALWNVDKVHDFAYVPDLAKALAVASVSDLAYDRFWICPHCIHGKTLQQIANDVATLAGRTSRVKITVMSAFVIYMLSPVMSFMKEMIEMKRFWTRDYTISGDADFCRTFGVQATPYNVAVQTYVDFYKSLPAKTKQ